MKVVLKDDVPRSFTMADVEVEQILALFVQQHMIKEFGDLELVVNGSVGIGYNGCLDGYSGTIHKKDAPKDPVTVTITI